jgi:hypothetical protein
MIRIAAPLATLIRRSQAPSAEGCSRPPALARFIFTGRKGTPQLTEIGHATVR